MRYIGYLNGDILLYEDNNLYGLLRGSEVYPDVVLNQKNEIKRLYNIAVDVSKWNNVDFNFKKYKLQLLEAFNRHDKAMLTYDELMSVTIDYVVIAEHNGWLCIEVLSDNTDFASSVSTYSVGYPRVWSQALLIREDNPKLPDNLVYYSDFCDDRLFGMCISDSDIYWVHSSYMKNVKELSFKYNVFMLKFKKFLSDRGLSMCLSDYELEDFDNVNTVVYGYGINDKIRGILNEYLGVVLIESIMSVIQADGTGHYNKRRKEFIYKLDIMSGLSDSDFNRMLNNFVIGSCASICDETGVHIDLRKICPDNKYFAIMYNAWANIKVRGILNILSDGLNQLKSKYIQDCDAIEAKYLLLKGKKFDFGLEFQSGFNRALDSIVQFLICYCDEVSCDVIDLSFKGGIYTCIIKPFSHWESECEVGELLEYLDIERLIKDNIDGFIGVAVHFLVRSIVDGGKGYFLIDFTDMPVIDFSSYTWDFSYKVSDVNTEIIIKYRKG